MPRLGSIDTASSPSRRRRPFSFSRVPKLRIRNVLLALVALFVARNFLRNDYRREGLEHLKENGMTNAEVEKLFPGVKRAEGNGDEMERMKKEIAFLLEEVKSLRSIIEHGNGNASDVLNNNDAREAALKHMDDVHMHKRKAKEAQLEEEDPDFKTARKIRGS